MGGLFEMVGSKKDGAVVKSLDDKSTKFVSSRIHNFSHLESIEVYTVRDNVNLVDLLQAIEASGEALPDQKDAAAIKAFFEKVYPDMDFERVYASDMKKMVKWYSVLKENDVEFKLSEVEEEEEEEEEEEAANETETREIKETEPVNATNKPAKDEAIIDTSVKEKLEKAPAKKAKAATAESATDESTDEAPKKKAPRKKKTEEL